MIIFCASLQQQIPYLYLSNNDSFNNVFKLAAIFIICRINQTPGHHVKFYYCIEVIYLVVSRYMVMMIRLNYTEFY